jgi:hypothetical protein
MAAMRRPVPLRQQHIHISPHQLRGFISEHLRRSFVDHAHYGVTVHSQERLGGEFEVVA